MKNHLRNRFLWAAVLLAMVFFTSQQSFAATGDLFISEYIEGSSNNKAIEIYNGTGAAVDLAANGYDIQMFFNGSASAGLTIPLTGSVADGDVYVLAQASATGDILAQANQTSAAGWFNGNDVVVLRKGGVVIDAIGQIGNGGTFAQDTTLVRNADVCAGDTNPDDAFDASVEWTSFAQNTFSNLGSHTADCGGVNEVGPKINEFSASTTGADVEFVEILALPNLDYSALTILEIEGDFGMGRIDRAFPVGTTDANGFWTTSVGNLSIENGTITLLLVEDFSGVVGDDIDTDDNGTIDFTPWVAIVDEVAVTDGGAGDLTYGVPVLGPNYDGVSNFAPGGASRIPDGFDTESATDWVRNDFDLAGIPGFAGSITTGEAYNTPGAPNEVYVAPPEACGDPFTAIYDVQGAGASSPLVGSEVAIEGIVVGDFQNNASADNGDLNGFHAQDPVGDGNAATSDGIFVYTPGGMDVSVGDAIRVRGSVSEFNGMTEITASQIWVCSAGNTLPAAATLSLPVASVDNFEPYEGMLVTFPQDLVISEYFNFDRFGEIVLTSERHLTPSAEFEPGPDAIAAAQDYLLDRITLDDGRTSQNPDPAIHPNGAEFDLSNLFRGGSTVTNVTGVIDYSFGLYRIQPTTGATYNNTNPRTAAPASVSGSLKVASFNVLNYFNTLDLGPDICGPDQDQECRGADNANERTRQLDKIVSALIAIDADVYGIIEVENTTGVEAMDDIIGGLNSHFGAGTYAYINTGTVGTDAIKVGLIYKTTTVTPYGAYAVLDSSVDARFIDTKNRPALAQSFMQNSDGAVFTVAVNHLKSKGSDCNDVGDPDTGNGAGNCNLTRKAAAEALVDWLATDPTNSGDSDFLIIGDLNSYDKEDPIDAILAGSDDTLSTSDDYTDLLYTFIGEDAYSYVFDGQVGYLDHGLANTALLPQVTGATVWHINADEADLIDYDTSFKQAAQDAIYASDPYRSSDHDPVIIGLELNGPPVCSSAAPSTAVIWPPNHSLVAIDILGVTDPEGDEFTITIDSIYQDEAVIGLDEEDIGPDGFGVGTSTAEVRAERDGEGNGRVYYIGFTATDSVGNTCSAVVEVAVPQSQGKNGAAVGDGPLVDSTILP